MEIMPCPSSMTRHRQEEHGWPKRKPAVRKKKARRRTTTSGSELLLSFLVTDVLTHSCLQTRKNLNIIGLLKPLKRKKPQEGHTSRHFGDYSLVSVPSLVMRRSRWIR